MREGLVLMFVCVNVSAMCRDKKKKKKNIPSFFHPSLKCMFYTEWLKCHKKHMHSSQMCSNIVTQLL